MGAAEDGGEVAALLRGQEHKGADGDGLGGEVRELPRMVMAALRNDGGGAGVARGRTPTTAAIWVGRAAPAGGG